MNEDVSVRPQVADDAQSSNGDLPVPMRRAEEPAILGNGSQRPSEDSADSAAPTAPDTTGELPPEAPSTAGPSTRSKVLGGVRELVETVLLALFFFFALRAIVQNFRVEGSSMYPSFTDGQYVLVNKALYAHTDSGTFPSWVPIFGGNSGGANYVFHGPERGDVIVFHPPPPNDPTRDFIKRVIGVPGDTIDIREGHVFVNGGQLAEPFIRQSTLPINVRFAHVVLGPDQYYVLGDNRGNSSDSRAWGPIVSDEIVGRTWLVYWPASAIKVAPNHAEPVAAKSQVPVAP